MQKSGVKITSYQAVVFLVATAVGVGFLMLPLRGVGIMPNVAWLPVVVVGLINLIAITLLGKALRYIEPMGMHQSSDLLLGRFIGKLVPLLILLTTLTILPAKFNILFELTTATIIPHTPRWFIIITFALLIAYIVDKGLTVIVRVFEILFPVALLAVFTVAILALGRVTPRFLYPANFRLGTEVLPSLIHLWFDFGGPIYLLLLYPYLQEPQKVVDIGRKSIILILVIYLIITVVSVGVFGPGEILRQNWPVLEVARAIHIRGALMHRADIVFAVVWILGSFTTAVALLFAGVYVIISWFGWKNRYVAFTLALGTALVAMIPLEILKTDAYDLGVGILTIVISTLIPLVLWVGARVQYGTLQSEKLK